MSRIQMGPRVPKAPPSTAEMLALVTADLAANAHKHQIGEVVARFVLPIRLAPTLNILMEMSTWARSATRKQTLGMMLKQEGRRWAKPLDRHATLVCIRYSQSAPDSQGAWTKFAIDRLTGNHEGLNIIKDDSGKFVTVAVEWRKKIARQGFFYMEVRA